MLTTEKTSWYLDGYLPTAREVVTVHLDPLPFRVGRAEDNSFRINQKTISPVHAEILEEAGNYFVRDLNSTNGTYLNGERIVGRTPVSHDDLLQFGDIAFRILRRSHRSQGQTFSDENIENDALALAQFQKLISERALTPHFQPIVNLDNGQTVGYEALSRSRLVGLETPQRMLDAALKLNLEVELSCAMRSEAMRVSHALPDNSNIFLNTHESELKKNAFLDSLRCLRNVAPSTPITIEIHEAAMTAPETLMGIREALQSLDMKFAFDDFGSGQTRLEELVAVDPDYLKFDRQILHNIHQASTRHHETLNRLVTVSKELGIVPLAQGVECAAGAETCRQLGFELAQGYYFGKPAPIRTC